MKCFLAVPPSASPFSWNIGGSLCPLFSTLPLDTKFLTFQVCFSFLCSTPSGMSSTADGALSNLLKWIQLSTARWTKYAWSLQECITEFNSTGHNWIQNEHLTMASFCHLSLPLGSEACIKAAIQIQTENRSEIWPHFNYTVKSWNLTFLSLSCLYNGDRLFIVLILIIVLNQQV